MRHLTTEELLLHCDDALAPELAAHVRECPSCHDAWLNLQEVLCEAEEAIRSGVPEEPLEDRVASRQALEIALFAAKQPVGFHLRWPAVYAAAAAMTFMVLGGYWQSRYPEPPRTQIAETRQPASLAPNPPIEAATVSSPLAEAPAAQMQLAGIAEPAVFEPQPDSVTAPEPAPTAPVESPQAAAVLIPEAVTPPSANAIQLARVEVPEFKQAPPRQSLPVVSTPAVPAPANATPAPVALPEPPNTMLVVVKAPIPTELPTQPSELLASDFQSDKPAATPLPKLVEGYWILTHAHVWQEDLYPVMTARGLGIEGTVEDAAAHKRIEAALRRQSIHSEAISVRLRRDYSDIQPRSHGPARVIRAAYSGPAGGPVRRALLGHFSDAARRSFVAPGASALEGELVRYVSDIYRNQSELLAHAYALQDFLGRMDSAELAKADPVTIRKFREIVRFHLQSIDEKEAVIYDRLSEALPRKVWGHRGDTGETGETGNWSDESNQLLRETLDLDSNLTALFGGSSLTVDAADPDQSCGELLNRIRTRIRRIKSRTQAL